MEYILQLDSDNRLPLPLDLIEHAHLKTGAHFQAHLEGRKVIIEYLPFSSQEQAKIIDQTIDDLTH